MSPERFEQLVGEVLDELPTETVEKLDNIAFCVEDKVPEDLLGLYEGIARPKRNAGYHGVLPDKITVYREAVLDEADPADEAAVREEIRRTLWHEIAHHLGWEEEEIEVAELRRGWREPDDHLASS